MSDQHAVRIHQRAGPEQLVFEAAPRPTPYADDVLVEVHAAGITPSELTWDSAFLSADGRSRLPAIPSHEVSDQGRLRAEVMEVFELAAARDAFETGLRDHVRGKLVLRVARDEAAAA